MEEIIKNIIGIIAEKEALIDILFENRDAQIAALVENEGRINSVNTELANLRGELSQLKHLNTREPYARQSQVAASAKDYQEINQAPFKPDYQQ